MKLPPGISSRTFNRVVRQFEQAVGREWVFTSEADVDLYRDAYTPFWGEEEELVASAAVAPVTVAEVQEVVRIANRYKIPVYPISTGKNLGYGGSAPTLSGSVVLDLKRMNRILEVDERNASILVEPGVSYFDAYRHLQEQGSKLWLDVPDPGWGSLIGNAMDRGGGYTAGMYRNHFDAHCGMEVVLANGEVMRTGMGAMPGAKSWQQYKTGYGPWVDGLFSQSNFGVCTKMGFWLMPEPEAFLSGIVSVPGYNDLIPLIDTLNFLENSNITNGMPFLGSPLVNPTLLPAEEVRRPPDPAVLELLAKPGGPSHAELEAYAHSKDIGMWACRLQFYGPPEVIRAQWEYAKKKYAAIPGVRFHDNEFYQLPLTPSQLEQVHKVVFGIPNLDIFFIGARSEYVPSPTDGHIWFSPIIPRTGEEVFKAQRVFSEAAVELGLPVPALPVAATYWLRSFLYLFGFPITKDVEFNRKNREAFRKLIKIAAAHGWGEYRTAPVYQDDIMATYSFNNHALLRFHETIKDALDPNGIIAPGRYGIWPRHLRREMKG
jgi:4-cresol dehydrogenase (hydroxylating)